MKVEDQQASTSSGTASLPELPVMPDDLGGMPENPNAETDLKTSEPPMKKSKCALDDIFGDVFVTKIEPGQTLETRVENEIMSYKSESNMPLNSNPLEWWKVREQSYPLLSKLAKMYLCIPATSVASECVFSTAAQRSCLSPDQVDCLIFLKKNLKL